MSNTTILVGTALLVVPEDQVHEVQMHLQDEFNQKIEQMKESDHLDVHGSMLFMGMGISED